VISIVIPLYNKELSIQKTLLSVLNQTFCDFEIIVVNDGSSDKSAERVQELNDNRIKLVSQENMGVCSARNRGIELSLFPLIAFLDADDYWDPHYLEEQIRFINDFPEAAMWGINFTIVNGNQTLMLYTGLPENFRGYVNDYFTMKRVSDLYCSSSVIIKKEAFNVAGNFDIRIKYSEDLDMWYRIILNFPTAFYSKSLVYYNHNAENRSLITHPKLNRFLPYFIDKYIPFKINADFWKYFNSFCASKLSYYYFETKAERKEAIEIKRKMDLSVLSRKYRLIYGTPWLVGYIILKLVKIKQKVF